MQQEYRYIFILKNVYVVCWVMLLWNGINKFWMHYNVEQILLLCIWTDIMDGCIWTPADTKSYYFLCYFGRGVFTATLFILGSG